MISKNKRIKKYDNRGEKNIDIAIEKLKNDKELFEKYCSKDVIQYLSRLYEDNEFNLSINGVEINKSNINNNKELIVDGIYAYVTKKEKCLETSEKELLRLKNLFYGVIIEAIARMTDHFILDKKYSKK